MLHNITISPLWGHKKEMDYAITLAKQKKMPHAWMFCGAKGIGKAQFAKNFAAFLLINFSSKKSLFTDIERDIFSDPVLLYHIENNTHGDLRVLHSEEEGKKTPLTTETIRDLRHFTSLTPSSSQYRIVIIDSIDNLHPSSANALLKQIEEPSPCLLWFLISHRPDNVLSTVKSRCHKIMLRPFDEKEMLFFLKEKFPSIPSSMHDNIIFMSQGSMGFVHHLASMEWYPLYQMVLENMVGLPHIYVTKLSHMVNSFTASEKNWSLVAPFFSCIFYHLLKGDLLKKVTEEEKLYALLHSRLSPEQWYGLWRNILKLLEEGNLLHLDRKALLFSIFGKVAEKISSV